MTTEKNKYLFVNKTNVRIDDINYGNHLCHSKMTSLVHNTRALFFRKHHFSEVDCFGGGLVVLNLNIDFVSQCFFDDILEIGLNINKIEKVRVELSYDVFNATTNKLAARATSLMGFIDLQKGKLKKIPVEFVTLVNSLIINTKE